MDNRILLGLISFIFLLLFASPVLATDYTVCPSGCNSTTIQGAIDSASDGDTVIVSAGTYNETINVSTSVTLLGANHDVDPAGSTDRGNESILSGGSLTVTSENVTVNGFKMTGEGIYTDFPTALNVNVSYNILVGIAGTRAINLYISNDPTCHLVDNAYVGYNTISSITGTNRAISVWGNDNVTIEYNHILDVTGEGIYSGGATANHNVNLTIRQNTINNVSGNGIATRNHAGTGIRILENNITDPALVGIKFSSSTGGLVSGNTITGSGESAIITSTPYSTISDNVIHNCNLVLPTENETKGWSHSYGSIHVDWTVEEDGYSAHHSVIDGNVISDSIFGITNWANDTTITDNEIYDMGKTYFEEDYAHGFWFKNFAIGVGSWWETNPSDPFYPVPLDPEGVVVSNNNIHDNYWNLFHDNVLHDLVEVVNATHNWWGYVIPNISKFSDNVTYYPYCLDADCTDDIEEQTSGFDGAGTTDFTAVSNWSAVTLILEDDDGMVNWTSAVDLNDSNLLFTDNVLMSYRRVEVDAGDMPELNAPATITFKDTGFASAIEFSVMRNDVACPDSICTTVSLDGDEVILTVTQMSEYELIEGWSSLVYAGEGLGNFLTGITSPVFNIILALGIIGGILAIFYGVASAIRKATSGAMRGI